MVNTPDLTSAERTGESLRSSYYNEVMNAGVTNLSDQKKLTYIYVG